MLEPLSHKTQSLPYGMLFSRMFRNFKVLLLPSIEVRPSKYDVFNHSTFRKMGYSLDKEGKWVLKKAKATSKEEDDDEDNEAVQ